jgi:hypothetical protein
MGAVAILVSAQSVARWIANCVGGARRADTHESANVPPLVGRQPPEHDIAGPTPTCR